ncbi:unnamed protein product [Auanema sp. JU1783]|nr:unnamed protein product [Auanema sp. JU1783]
MVQRVKVPPDLLMNGGSVSIRSERLLLTRISRVTENNHSITEQLLLYYKKETNSWRSHDDSTSSDILDTNRNLDDLVSPALEKYDKDEEDLNNALSILNWVNDPSSSLNDTEVDQIRIS